MKRRLFVGTFLAEAQRPALTVDATSADRLAAEWQRKIRWVRPEKFHLTWVFLGDLTDDVRPEIEAKLGQLVQGVQPMDLTYTGTKLWPHPRRPKTFVVVPDVVPTELMQLAERIKKEMTPYAERIDLKYRPHLTLGRMDQHNGRIEVPAWFPLNSALPLTQRIDRIELIESDLRGNKEYRAIATWMLSV